MPDRADARRWTVIAAGLLILALAFVVIYSGPKAFRSPVALVVIAAIGLAALLLQIRFRRDLESRSRLSLFLNIVGVLCAAGSLFADYLHLRGAALDLVAFSAVACFAVSGTVILHALRRPPRSPRSSSSA